jgi:hypothetical protein
MPFDSKPAVPVAPDLTKPSLEGLSWLLRHEMPAKFSWDYRILVGFDRQTCGTTGCALGLAEFTWGRSSVEVAYPFGMPEEDADRIFYSAGTYGCRWHEVTAEMVADKIDEYLAEHKQVPDAV